MAQIQNKKLAQAWKIFEDKLQNATTNVDTHSKYLELATGDIADLEKQIEAKKAEIQNLEETIQINTNLRDVMLTQKQETVDAGEALAKAIARISKLPLELQAIAKQLGGYPEPPTDPTDPEPETTPTPAPAPEKTEPEKPASLPGLPLPGNTASEQIAEIDNKPEDPQNLGFDGYSFEITSKGQSFEFYTDGDARFEGVANIHCVPVIVGLRTGDRKLMTYTSHPGEFLASWDKHLPAIEKALRVATGNENLNVQRPRNKLAVDLPVQKFRDMGTIVLKSWKFTLIDARDFQEKDTTKTSLKFSLQGKGCSKNGCEVFYNFSKNNSLYEMGIKKGDKYYADSKRLQQPKEMQPLREIAIEFLAAQLPTFHSAWEDEMEYFDVKQQPAGPAACAESSAK